MSKLPPSLHTAIIESQYMPPIETFARLAQFRRVQFEAYEHWVKRSYRNRCRVAGPGGELSLSVPLHREGGTRRVMKDIRIAYTQDWRKVHWQTFTTGYRRSPYFEYYEDRFEPFFRDNYEKLIDLNTALFRFFAEILELDLEIAFTERWDPQVSIGCVDLRDAMSPRAGAGRPDPFYKAPQYSQVFVERHGFLPDLSIADLVFNYGPKAAAIVREALD